MKEKNNQTLPCINCGNEGNPPGVWFGAAACQLTGKTTSVVYCDCKAGRELVNRIELKAMLESRDPVNPETISNLRRN